MTLRSVREREHLPQVADLAVLAPEAVGPGAWMGVQAGVFTAPGDLAAWLEGRLGGSGWPDWATGAPGAWRGDTRVARVTNAWWWPRYGVVADAQGAVFEVSAMEARTRSPDLSRLRGVRADPDGTVRFQPPRRPRRLRAASVFAPFGGIANYGHFLLDALPSLLALEEAGLTRDLPPASPPLAPWARELLALAFGDGLAVQETPAGLVQVEAIAFSNLMDHHLHRPNATLLRLRERILARLPPPARRDRRVYLTRRRLPQRLMLEERALEAALVARGFEVVEPERLSPAEQAALMTGCAVVVAPAGAALANALFLAPGARVFELLPSCFASHWVRDLARLAGLEWFGWSAPAPLDRAEEPWAARAALLPRRASGRYGYAWRLDLPALLRFLDARL